DGGVSAPDPVCPQPGGPVAAAGHPTPQPTPPDAPSTSTRSSTPTCPTSCTTFHAVTPATPTAAASRRSTPSGTSLTASLGTTAACAHTPSRAVPSPSPWTTTGRPSSAPAASKPSVRGRGPSGATLPSAV